jgi:tetratricopeptide (TPR) repeat protein
MVFAAASGCVSAQVSADEQSGARHGSDAVLLQGEQHITSGTPGSGNCTSNLQDADYQMAIDFLRDWDLDLMLEEDVDARRALAHQAFLLGSERHAARDYDNAAKLLGHALEIYREVGGAEIYAVWLELARLHMAMQRPAFALAYIDEALQQVANAGEAASVSGAFFALKEQLHARPESHG